MSKEAIHGMNPYVDRHLLVVSLAAAVAAVASVAVAAAALAAAVALAEAVFPSSRQMAAHFL